MQPEQYIILTDFYAHRLVQAVNKKMVEGYEVQGGVTAAYDPGRDRTEYSQAMVFSDWMEGEAP